MELPTDNLQLDCLIAERLGWTECRVIVTGGDESTQYPLAVGRDPARPYLRDLAPIPDYSTDIREVIEVCRERGWSIRITPSLIEIEADLIGNTLVRHKDNYPRAAAEALAGMLAQKPTTGEGGE